jgi:uncharacterized membrane protein
MANALSSFVHTRHGPFLIGVAAAAIAAIPSILVTPAIAVQLITIAFFVAYLAAMAFKVPRLTAAQLKKHAANSDEPTWLIVFVALVAVAVCVISLFTLTIDKGSAGTLVLALASVILGWMTIHTMTAMHYAHRYWQPGPAAKDGNRGTAGGLDFPGNDEPNGLDFLYFSFVIGMTAQTSDVGITTSRMRGMNLIHAVISFFFNTILIAAAVNVAVSIA